MLSAKIKRKIRYAYEVLKNDASIPSNNEHIDVIIPAIEKDISILPLCIEGLRTCVCHPIDNIYIVSPKSNAIEAFCRKNGLTFVDEESVLGYSPRTMQPVIAGAERRNRATWIFQQLLKLSGAVGTNRHFLVIDSDHILLRPHTFITADHKTVFYQSLQYHKPYYDAIARLLGIECNAKLSYIAHKMVFDRTVLSQIRCQIEQNTGMSWDKAIIAVAERADTISGFSEFETYGNFVADGNKVHLPWRHKSLGYSKITNYENLRQQYASRYRAITFPSYFGHK